MEAWVVGLFTLGGAIIGGFISHFTAARIFQRQQKQQNQMLRLSKLEEIYKATNRLEEYHKKIFGTGLRNWTSEGAIPIDVSEPVPLSELMLLIDFYAPELGKHMKALESAHKNVGKVIANTVTIAATFNKVNLEALTAATDQVQSACEALRDASVREGRKILQNAHST